MIIDIFYPYYRQAVANVGGNPSNVFTFDDAAKIIFQENYNNFSQAELQQLKEKTIHDILSIQNEKQN